MAVLGFALSLGPLPSHAVLQGQVDPTGATHVIMILSSRGGFCSGVVIEPNVILTAGHCVTGASAYRAHYKSASGTAVMLEPKAIAVHPGFVPAATRSRTKSIDLALVRLREPLPPPFSPISLSDEPAPRAGEPMIVGGYGLAQEGQASTGGSFRTADLVVIEPYGPSSILVWLRDGQVDRDGQGAGACGGDSGGPILRPNGRLVAITAFAEGSGRARCGSLTQGMLVAPQRAWIKRVLAGWQE